MEAVNHVSCGHTVQGALCRLVMHSGESRCREGQGECLQQTGIVSLNRENLYTDIVYVRSPRYV